MDEITLSRHWYFRKVTDVLDGWVVPVVRLLGAAGGRGGAVSRVD